MQLTQSIAKVFGYIKISSLVMIIVLGIYGVAAGKGELSTFSSQNALQKDGDDFFPSFSHIGS